MRFLSDVGIQASQVVDRAGNLDEGAIGLHDREATFQIFDGNDLGPSRRKFSISKGVVENRNKILSLNDKTDKSKKIQDQKRRGENQISDLLSKQKSYEHREKEDECEDGYYRRPLDESGRSRVDGYKPSEISFVGLIHSPAVSGPIVW